MSQSTPQNVHYINEHAFRLLPERAVIWENTRTLLLADLHLGKIHHFRKSGIALPLQAQFENFDRLSYVLLNNDVSRVIILGDLFHSHYNESWEGFKSFIRQFDQMEFILVKGNHDILPASFYLADNLRIEDDIYGEAGFQFSHHPLKEPQCYNFCGHIHPAVKLKGPGKQLLRLPCFYFAPARAILPAFGTFTGSATLDIRDEDKVYAIADSRVVRVL